MHTNVWEALLVDFVKAAEERSATDAGFNLFGSDWQVSVYVRYSAPTIYVREHNTFYCMI